MNIWKNLKALWLNMLAPDYQATMLTNGTWTVTDSAGHRHSEPFASKAQAEAFALELEWSDRQW
jgi:hypothetical protein